MVRLYSTKDLMVLWKKVTVMGGGGGNGSGNRGEVRLTHYLDVIFFLKCHGNVLGRTELTKTASIK